MILLAQFFARWRMVRVTPRTLSPLTRTSIGDEATLALWGRFRELSITKYEEVYARLNVRFDVYGGESLVSSEQIKAAMQSLSTKGLLSTKTSKESDNNWKEKRVEMAQGIIPSDDGDDAEELAQGQGLALAVDLEKWKLGKPVVQKPVI
jgi:arginyl-tRNA synthetase